VYCYILLLVCLLKASSYRRALHGRQKAGCTVTFPASVSSSALFFSTRTGPLAVGSKSSSTSSTSSRSGKPSASSAEPIPPPGAICFIGNLPFDVTEKDIGDMLDEFLGPNTFTAIKIAKGKKTNRPLGFLFVHFKDASTAASCVQMTNQMNFMGRTLNSNIKEVEGAVASGAGAAYAAAALGKKKKVPLVQANTVYLSNLDYTLTEEEIFNMCEDLVGQGMVNQVRIPLDKNNKVPRGFCHIEFKQAKDVEAGTYLHTTHTYIYIYISTL